MFTFFKKISIENFKTVLAQTFDRMPLPLLLSVVTFVLFVMVIHIEDMSIVWENRVYKSILTLIVTFFLSIGVYIYAEGRGILSRTRKYLYQVPVILFGLFFYNSFEEDLFTNFQAETMVYITSTIIGVLSFLFVAPFITQLLRNTLAQNDFYQHAYALIIKTLMSFIVGISTMLLGFIALGSVFTLFDITIINEGNWFGYWAAFSLTLFAPLFFLTQLPGGAHAQSDSVAIIRKNKFYFFIVNYIGLPAITLYFAILYAYTIKVLINFSQWPQGQVAWMVIGFSIFGYSVYSAAYIFKSQFKLSDLLHRYLPIAVLLQTPMLFYAIGLRINQYDITINRYLVVVFGLWLLGLSLYFLFSKTKYIASTFYSLLVVIIVISIGPWSVYSLPESRQAAHLEQNLRTANILQAGVVVPLKKYTDVSQELSGEVYGGIEYLCNFHGCDTLEKYFSAELESIKSEHRKNFEDTKQERIERLIDSGIQGKDTQYANSIKEEVYREINPWEVIQELTEVLKVKRYHGNEQSDAEPRFLQYTVQQDDFNTRDESVLITNYDYYVRVIEGGGERLGTGNSGYSVTIDMSNEQMEIYHGGLVVAAVSLEGITKKLVAKRDASLGDLRGFDKQSVYLEQEDLTFKLSHEKFDIKLVLDAISVKNPLWQSLDDTELSQEGDLPEDALLKIRGVLPYSYTNGYALLRLK